MTWNVSAGDSLQCHAYVNWGMRVSECVCVCVCVCVLACVRASERACVCVCLFVRVYVVRVCVFTRDILYMCVQRDGLKHSMGTRYNHGPCVNAGKGFTLMQCHRQLGRVKSHST